MMAMCEPLINGEIFRAAPPHLIGLNAARAKGLFGRRVWRWGSFVTHNGPKFYVLARATPVNEIILCVCETWGAPSS
jgi:hypothetical protein